jgi:protein SCO1
VKRLIGFLALTLLASCSRRESTAQEAPSAVRVEPSAPSTKGESVYQLDMKLTDQDGKAALLDAYRGHLTLVSMFYATCPAACPKLVHDVKMLEGRLDPAARADLRVLLVSFDTKRDGPEALMKMVQKHEVDVSRWKLAVAGSDSSARELAAVLGFQYRKQENGEYSHSSRVSLIDEAGVVVAQADGFGQATEELLPEIKRRLAVKLPAR